MRLTHLFNTAQCTLKIIWKRSELLAHALIQILVPLQENLISPVHHVIQMQYVRSMEEPSDRKVNHDILKPKTSRPQTTCKITNDTFDIARIPESATKI